MSETDKAVYLRTVAELRNIERRNQSLQAEHARCAERFAAKDESITAQDAEIKRLRSALQLGLRLVSDESGWGTHRRMEGSELYSDATVFKEAARAALATPAPEGKQPPVCAKCKGTGMVATSNGSRICACSEGWDNNDEG